MKLIILFNIILTLATHQASSSLGLGLAWLWAGERGAREDLGGLVTPGTLCIGRKVLGGALMLKKQTLASVRERGIKMGL